MEQKLQSKVVSEVDEVDSIHDSDMAKDGVVAKAESGHQEKAINVDDVDISVDGEEGKVAGVGKDRRKEPSKLGSNRKLKIKIDIGGRS